MDSSTFLKQSKHRIESFLSNYLTVSDDVPNKLSQAMTYSVLNGGKRIRAAMVYSIQAPLNVSDDVANIIAGALECIHAASLVHDDLPAMDNDCLRRNKASCHEKFDEGTAILCGDALLMHGMGMILNIPKDMLSAEITLKIARHLNTAISAQGIMGGQMRDMTELHNIQTLEHIESIYTQKTCLLLGIGLELMAIAASQETLAKSLKKWSHHLGLAFQIQDDLLDYEASTEIIGKPQFSDLNTKKNTVPQIIGIENSKERLNHHFKLADEVFKSNLSSFKTLNLIADIIRHRSY